MIEVFESHFVNDGAQIYLILQQLYYTLKRLRYTEKVVSWNCKGLSPEKPTTSLPPIKFHQFLPSIKWYKNSNCCLIFRGSYLKQKKYNFYCSKYNKFLLFMNQTHGHKI